MRHLATSFFSKRSLNQRHIYSRKYDGTVGDDIVDGGTLKLGTVGDDTFEEGAVRESRGYRVILGTVKEDTLKDVQDDTI